MRDPGRLTMPDGLRSRVMAPVYALMISFFAVLLLGSTMHNPETGGIAPAPPQTPGATPTQAPAKPPIPVRLVKRGVNERDRPVEAAAVALKGAKVRILPEPVQELVVDENAEIPLTASGGPLTICVQLPKGWTAPNANSKLLPKFSCWEAIDLSPGAHPTGLITLVVAETEG